MSDLVTFKNVRSKAILKTQVKKELDFVPCFSDSINKLVSKLQIQFCYGSVFLLFSYSDRTVGTET